MFRLHAGPMLALIVTIMTAVTAWAGPAISVSVFPQRITNEGQEATFTLSASSPAARRTAINIAMTGDTFLGSDYVLIGNFNRGKVILEKGQSSTTVTLHSLSDDPAPPREIATMNILGGRRYAVGRPSRATVAIDNLP